MPSPKSLRVGDRVRFVGLPAGSAQDCQVLAESLAFMKKMIARSWPSRVFRIDDQGLPWIMARTREKGRFVYHFWAISESSGWRRVKRRSPVTKKKH